MTRRRFPRWMRFPHRPLPYWWRGWREINTITPAEIAAILAATMRPRRPVRMSRKRWAAKRRAMRRGRHTIAIDRHRTPAFRMFEDSYLPGTVYLVNHSRHRALKPKFDTYAAGKQHR